jgi:hypothetical protein
VDDYGSDIPNGWNESITVEIANQRELIEALQKQSEICNEEISMLKTEVTANSAMTKETRDNSSELLDILNLMKGGMRVIEFIGKIGKVFAMIGAGYAAYMKLKSGEWPFK